MGISAVTAEGHIRARELELKSILDGELAAIHLALTSFAKRAQRFEILTDPQKAVQYVQGRTRLKSEVGESLKKAMDELATLGIEVSVSWVRGHNGHVLNSYADRAAVIARRCAQFGTDNKAQLLKNLRAELHSEIQGIEPQQWLLQQHVAA
ncbi:RNase H family protein [Corynebacterium callunae]|uniref:RNase H family protein n=1 Tax=Corynebacterium callunae TaxID=1721 RepID=UPI003982599A